MNIQTWQEQKMKHVLTTFESKIKYQSELELNSLYETTFRFLMSTWGGVDSHCTTILFENIHVAVCLVAHYALREQKKNKRFANRTQFYLENKFWMFPKGFFIKSYKTLLQKIRKTTGD